MSEHVQSSMFMTVTSQ